MIVILSVMPVSQLQAAGPYNPRIAQKSIPKTMKICKRAVVGYGEDSNLERSFALAKRFWSRNTKDIYGTKANWHSAKNKKRACQFNGTKTGYRCRVTANPCYANAAQNSR